MQNVTDIDDPLLERAQRDGEDWVALAERETELFRDDMAALRVLPPEHYVGAVEAIPADRAAGAAAARRRRRVPRGRRRLLLRRRPRARFGYESGLDAATMLALSAERGGDPERPGKRDPLDPVLWRAPGRASRPGTSPLGPGRPGWHIECAAIALDRLGDSIDVQGGGSDLVFPHHEMSAAHAEVADRRRGRSPGRTCTPA